MCGPDSFLFQNSESYFPFFYLGCFTPVYSEVGAHSNNPLLWLFHVTEEEGNSRSTSHSKWGLCWRKQSCAAFCLKNRKSMLCLGKILAHLNMPWNTWRVDEGECLGFFGFCVFSAWQAQCTSKRGKIVGIYSAQVSVVKIFWCSYRHLLYASVCFGIWAFLWLQGLT